ncbi:MAG: LysR family transcriptional regulator [Alphaproteobacteria bacterium]
MKRTLPPLNALRAFEAYSRHGKLVAAAEELCVTHGAVSRQIKRLEETLGIRLLAKTNGVTRLTKAGERYAGALHRLFDDLERATPAHSTKGVRHLELLCPGSFSVKWLLPRIGGFADMHPEIDVEVVDSSGPWHPAPAGPHAAIRLKTYEGISDAEVDADVFMPRFHGPVLSPDLVGSGITEEALLKLPRVYTRSTHREWADWGAETGRILPPASRELGFDRSFHTIEAATSGLGVAIGDWAMVLPELESGELVAPLGFSPSAAPYVLLRAKGDPNPDVQMLKEWLIAEGAKMDDP